MNKNLNFVITLFLCIGISILAVTGYKFEVFEYLARFNELPDLTDYLLNPIAKSMVELSDLVNPKIDYSGNVINDILNSIKAAIDFLAQGMYTLVQIITIIPRIIIYIIKVIIAFVPFIEIDAIGNFGGAWS